MKKKNRLWQDVDVVSGFAALHSNPDLQGVRPGTSTVFVLYVVGVYRDRDAHWMQKI